MKVFIYTFLGFMLCAAVLPLHADKPIRVGTTTANFLEIGYGSSGNAMGDAVVSSIGDLSALYWNPARLSTLKQNEAMFMYQPWFADINTSFASVGLTFRNIGTFAVGLFQVDYGDMKVTSMEMQDGTGEYYSAADYAVSLGFGRALVDWLAFGASAKYITSKIWHSSADAFALDLGMTVNTFFFSPSGDRKDGLTIGMSISNYGSRMKYDGMDLRQPIDLLPYEEGNYKYAEGKFETQSWELPLIFRIGAAVYPISTASQRLTLEVDALHPNNNSESVNLGGQWEYNIPTFGTFFLRGGYKALFMEDTEYGPSFGAGLKYTMMNNLAFRVDYAFRDIGILGSTHSYTFSFMF